MTTASNEVHAAGMQVETGGAAFFVSTQLAMTARSCVPAHWRRQPELQLLDPASQTRIASRVVAENQEHSIALLEVGTPVAGVAPLALADGAPAVPHVRDEHAPGTPLVQDGAVAGMVAGRGKVIPASALRDLVSFHARFRDAVPGSASVVYARAAEGLFLHGLKSHLSPALTARLLELGLDLRGELRATYSRAAWIQMLETSVAQLYPHLTAEEGYDRLGQASVDGLARTAIGRIVLLIARWQEPRRSLQRLREGFSAVNNFMTVDMKELGPCHFRMLFNETYGCPAYFRGAIRAAMTHAGAEQVQVVIQDATANVVALDVRWRQAGEACVTREVGAAALQA